jgi:predicted PurR-regulated permease PerM
LNKTLGYVALVLATLTGVFLLWQLRGVLVLFAFALALAAAMRRPIDTLARRGLPRGLAIILTYLIGLGLLAGLLYALSESLIVEGQAAGMGFNGAWEHIRTVWPAGSPLQQFIAQQLPQPEQIYQAVLGTLSLHAVQTGLGFTLSVFEALSRVALVLVLSIYWSIDRDRFERLWLSMLQAERRIRARTIWQRIEEGVGAHIRSTVIVLVASGLLLAFGYRLLGLDAPVTVAAVAAVIGLIPLLGWALAVVPAILIGLIDGPGVAALAGLCTLVVLLVLKTVVVPRLLDHRRSSAMLTIVVMVALTDVLGILGLLLAVPVAAVIEITLGELLAPSVTTTVRRQPAADPVAQYIESMAAVQAQMLTADGQLSPTQVSMVERLTRLGDDTQLALQGKG